MDFPGAENALIRIRRGSGLGGRDVLRFGPGKLFPNCPGHVIRNLSGFFPGQFMRGLPDRIFIFGILPARETPLPSRSPSAPLLRGLTPARTPFKLTPSRLVSWANRIRVLLTVIVR